MKEVRDRSDVGQGLINEARAFFQVGLAARIDGPELIHGERKIQLGHGEQLAGAVVQIAAEPAALFIAQIQEVAGDNSQLLLSTPEFRDVGIEVQAAERRSLGISPDGPSTGNGYFLSTTGFLLEFVFPVALSSQDILDLSQRPR